MSNSNVKSVITGKDLAALVATRKDGYLVNWTFDDGSRRTYACADFLSLKSLVGRLAKETNTVLTWGANGLPRANGLQVLGLHVYFAKESDGKTVKTRRHSLTDSRQILRASVLWDKGESLGEIAEEIGCDVYQLDFLYRELLPSLRRVDITPLIKEQEPTQVKHKKPDARRN